MRSTRVPMAERFRPLRNGYSPSAVATLGERTARGDLLPRRAGGRDDRDDPCGVRHRLRPPRRHRLRALHLSVLVRDRAHLVKRRWWALAPAAIALRALQVRMTVQPRRRYWHTRLGTGDLLLVALGDSLTQGIGASRPARSWLALFATHLEETSGRTGRVDNRARYGAKVAGVLAAQLPLPARCRRGDVVHRRQRRGPNCAGGLPGESPAGVCRAAGRCHRRRCARVPTGPADHRRCATVHRGHGRIARAFTNASAL